MPVRIDVERLRNELIAAGHGNKTEIMKRYAAACGVSEAMLHRELRLSGGKQKTRSRGLPADADGRDLIGRIADMKMEGFRLSLEQRELRTEDCIRHLIDMNVPGADRLVVGTVNRKLAQYGFRAEIPRVLVQASYSNQVLLFDFSRSKHFQVQPRQPGQSDYLLKVSGRELHYKQSDKRLRTWLVQIMDDYSRLRLVRAYAAAGESSLMGLEFLRFCWTRPEDGHPMRFLPEILKTDQGAFAKDESVKNSLESLGIVLKKSMPYNKESQGKIENGWKQLWIRFEAWQAYILGEGKTITLSSYNDMLHEFVTKEQHEKHPLSEDTRGEMYRDSILVHRPRVTDADAVSLAFRVEYRSVPETLAVQVDGHLYEAPVYAMGKRIRVKINRDGRLVGELQEEDPKPFELKPYKIREYGDFEHRPGLTYRQQREQMIRGAAMDTKRVSDPDKAVANDLYVEDNRIFMPARPEKVDPDSPFVEKTDPLEFDSVVKAKLWIGDQIRQIVGGAATYADFADQFDPLLQETLDKDRIRMLIEDLREAVRGESMGVIR